jgi:hypothetical protein
MKPTLQTEAKSEAGLATRCQGSSARPRPASLQAGPRTPQQQPEGVWGDPVIFRLVEREWRSKTTVMKARSRRGIALARASSLPPGAEPASVAMPEAVDPYWAGAEPSLTPART